MTYSLKNQRIIASLVSNGFSREESREYVKNKALQRKELRETRLVRTGGIKRVRISWED